MSKDLVFRLRLDATDRERLKAVAAHYSATESTAVRILIKEKRDALLGPIPDRLSTFLSTFDRHATSDLVVPSGLKAVPTRPVTHAAGARVRVRTDRGVLESVWGLVGYVWESGWVDDVERVWIVVPDVGCLKLIAEHVEAATA